MAVTISEDNLKLIKTRLAYPSADKILLTDAELKAYVIKHALDDYFVKFPKISEAVYTITNESEIDFPDSNTFGVLDVRIVGKGYTSVSGGSFWDLVLLQCMGITEPYNSSMYGSKIRGYNPSGLRQTRYMNQMVNDSTTNLATYKYRVNQNERKLYAYSSLSATLNVTWALWSEDFSDVHFQFKWDIIKLCQAYYMQYIADSSGLISDSTQEVTIDVERLSENSKQILEEIRDKWNEYPSALILRQ